MWNHCGRGVARLGVLSNTCLGIVLSLILTKHQKVRRSQYLKYELLEPPAFWLRGILSRARVTVDAPASVSAMHGVGAYPARMALRVVLH